MSVVTCRLVASAFGAEDEELDLAVSHLPADDVVETIPLQAAHSGQLFQVLCSKDSAAAVTVSYRRLTAIRVGTLTG